MSFFEVSVITELLRLNGDVLISGLLTEASREKEEEPKFHCATEVV